MRHRTPGIHRHSQHTAIFVVFVIGLSLVASTLTVSFVRARSGSQPVNFVGNEGFDKSLSGWNKKATGGSISRAGGGRSGGYAALLRPDIGSRVALRDRPQTVTDVRRGSVYRAAAWVRATAEPMRVVVRLRELIAAATRPVGCFGLGYSRVLAATCG